VHRATIYRWLDGSMSVPIVVELLLRLMVWRGIRPAEVTASRSDQRALVAAGVTFAVVIAALAPRIPAVRYLSLVIVLLASGAAQWWLYRKNSSAYVPPSEFLTHFFARLFLPKERQCGQWRPADRAPGPGFSSPLPRQRRLASAGLR
jgi:hypothetical protein